MQSTKVGQVPFLATQPFLLGTRALGRDVVLITQNSGDVPFDVRHIRHLRYLNNGEGRQSLQAEVAQRLRTLTGRD